MVDVTEQETSEREDTSELTANTSSQEHSASQDLESPSLSSDEQLTSESGGMSPEHLASTTHLHTPPEQQQSVKYSSSQTLSFTSMGAAVTLESKSSSRADMTLESENQCSLTITTLSGMVHLSTSNGGSTRYDKAQIVTQPSTSQDGAPRTVTQPRTNQDGAPRTVTQPSTSQDGAPGTVTQPSTSQDGAPVTVTQPSNSHDGAPRTVTQPSTSQNGAPGTVTQPSTSHNGAPGTVTQLSTSHSFVTDKLGRRTSKFHILGLLQCLFVQIDFIAQLFSHT